MGNDTQNAHKITFKITHLHVKMHLWRRHFVFLAGAKQLTSCGAAWLFSNRSCSLFLFRSVVAPYRNPLGRRRHPLPSLSFTTSHTQEGFLVRSEGPTREGSLVQSQASGLRAPN